MSDYKKRKNVSSRKYLIPKMGRSQYIQRAFTKKIPPAVISPCFIGAQAAAFGLLIGVNTNPPAAPDCEPESLFRVQFRIMAEYAFAERQAATA
ncbi:hypothetical protein, partial [Achromobacter xylosoxidans]|uniref:hypothetical protein n=1 Tax=Alcaligenes xylosoxydans xylosoxydans TaxID=85698 RepID=UPI001E3DCF79